MVLFAHVDNLEALSLSNKYFHSVCCQYARAVLDERFPVFASNVHFAEVRSLACLLKPALHMTIFPFEECGDFSFFTVVGSGTRSYMFPGTFRSCFAFSREEGITTIEFDNARMFFQPECKFCCDDYFVIVDSDMNLTVSVLDFSKRVWRHVSLPFVGITHTHLVCVGDAIGVLVWKRDTFMYLVVDRHSLDTEVRVDAQPLDLGGCVVYGCCDHTGRNFLVGYEQCRRTYRVNRHRLSWVKQFDPVTLTWSTVEVGDATANCFYQPLIIGDFFCLFKDKYRKLAIWHKEKWITDLRMPFVTLPPWNTYSVGVDGLVMWDLWPARIDLVCLSFF